MRGLSIDRQLIYGFCSIIAHYSSNPGLVLLIKELLIKNHATLFCKDQEIAFSREYIFVFMPYFTGVI